MPPNYDTSSLVKDPATGMIKTGQYTTVNPTALNNQGYQQALTYASNAPTTKDTQPIASLSTDSAAATLQSKVDKLNGYSPKTAPGYVAPTTNTTTPAANSKTDINAIPKAYFANEDGQEAEYTQSQLDDPSTQKFLKDNGYVMTRTQGPSTLSTEVSGLNSQIGDLAQRIVNYNVDSDPVFAAQSKNISQGFDELRKVANTAETDTAKALTSYGLRTGTSRYDPQSIIRAHAGLMSDLTDKLGDISVKENAAITQARSAYQSGQYTIFNDQMNALEKVRDDKAKTLDALNKTISDATTKVKEATKQSSRDSAIAGLVSQGITDPAQIMSYLNNHEDGSSTGGNFTAKEIGDTLKSLAPSGELDKLTGATKDFFILKGQGDLPSNISSLPEGSQLFAYLQMQHAASTIGSGGSKISLANIKDVGLPFATVGMNLNDIVNDLQNPTPPAWFLEKLSREAGVKNLKADGPGVQQAWDESRKESIAKAEGTALKDSPNYTKAKQYFSTTYDGLSDDQLDQISQQVVTYVNGGMSYKDAVAQTESDVGQ